MTVNTKKVTGRRTVHYASLNDLLSEAEQISREEFQTLGNWSPAQIYKHLAMSFDSSIDGMDFKLPAPVRFVMNLLMKRRFLTKPIPAGFKSTEKFIPRETSIEEGLEALRTAIERQARETSRVDHPGFGKLTNKEWDDFNLRHAEMHMSFVIPNS